LAYPHEIFPLLFNTVFWVRLLTWSDENDRQINPPKTKMILGSAFMIGHHWQFKTHHWKEFLSKNCYVYSFLLTYAGKHILSISFLKLCHGYMFFKPLNKAGLSSFHWLHFYTTVIRPVLEYASPSGTVLLPSLKLFNEGLSTLFFVTPPPPPIFLHWRWLTFHLFEQDAWTSLSVFRNICRPDNCLHHLLPHRRDLAMTSRLRKPTVYARPSLRTKQYSSTVSYALLKFQ